MNKFLLTLAAGAISTSAALAAEVTLNVNDATNFEGTLTEETTKDDGSVSAAKHYQPIESFDLGDFNFVFETGENGKTAPAYYWATSTNANQQRTVRLYGSNTMTITAPAGTEITAISITMAKNDKSTAFTVNTGTCVATEKLLIDWTGSANSITFTSADTKQIKEFTITTGSADKETLAAPTFDPASGIHFSESVSVSIAAAEGAVVYYTIDGENPTTSSAKYDGTPIVCNETTTIKAFAVKDGFNDSPVATAVFTKDVTMSSLADLIVEGLEDEQTEFTYTGEAVVTYVNGQNMYIRDETCALLVYGNVGTTYEQGDVISGFRGTFKNYYSTFELVNPSSFGEPLRTETVEPEEFNIGTVSEFDQNQYVIFRDVNIVEEDGYTCIKNEAGDTLPLYDKFKVGIPTTDEAKDVIGLLSYYQAKGADFPMMQLYPVEFSASSTSIAINSTDASAAEYYTINGTRVAADNLAAGIYIVKTAGRVAKVAVR